MKYVSKIMALYFFFFSILMMSNQAFAGICPTTSGLPAYGGGGAGSATACNMVITFNSNGSISTTFGPQSTYDSIDDALIGIVNNSGHALTSINLSGNNIFGFDGDGVDGYTGTPNLAAGMSSSGFYQYEYGVDQYGGSDAYFTNFQFTIINGFYHPDNGTVNFLNSISGNGGEDYFALEESININAPPQVTGTNLSATPEPSTLALFGTGILLIGVMAYRKKNATA